MSSTAVLPRALNTSELNIESGSDVDLVAQNSVATLRKNSGKHTETLRNTQSPIKEQHLGGSRLRSTRWRSTFPAGKIDISVTDYQPFAWQS